MKPFDLSRAAVDPATRKRAADMTAVLAVKCQGDAAARIAVLDCAVALLATVAVNTGQRDAAAACEGIVSGVRQAMERAPAEPGAVS